MCKGSREQYEAVAGRTGCRTDEEGGKRKLAVPSQMYATKGRPTRSQPVSPSEGVSERERDFHGLEHNPSAFVSIVGYDADRRCAIASEIAQSASVRGVWASQQEERATKRCSINKHVPVRMTG